MALASLLTLSGTLKTWGLLVKAAQLVGPPAKGWWAKRRERRRIERTIGEYLIAAASPLWSPDRCIRLLPPTFPIVEGECWGLHASGMLKMRLGYEWLAPFPAQSFEVKGSLEVYLPADTVIWPIDEVLRVMTNSGVPFRGDVLLVDVKKVITTPAKFGPVTCGGEEAVRHVRHGKLKIECRMSGPWRPDELGVTKDEIDIWVPLV
jgi:hypothetical protein